MQFDFSRAGQDGGLDVGITFVDRRDARVDRRFAQHGDLQRPHGQKCRRNFGAQTLAHFRLEQGFEFMRRAGKQHDDVLATVELAAEPLSGSGAVGIGKHGGALENIGLLGVVGRHLPAAAGETLLQASQDFRIAPQLQAERFGNGFAGQIVFGGAEAAAEDHDVGAKQAVLGRRHQPAEIVADDAFENYVDAQQVELLGKVERVGVHAVGRKHLGTHRNDFGIHALEV